jgi:hypothetical protein
MNEWQVLQNAKGLTNVLKVSVSGRTASSAIAKFVYGFESNVEQALLVPSRPKESRYGCIGY